MNKMLSFLCSTLLLCGAVSAVNLEPSSADMFYLAPGRPATLTWRVGESDATDFSYVLRDYLGRGCGTGKGAVRDGMLTLELALERGFYEIEFPEAARSFGLVSLADYAGDVDPFYGADAAWSWLEQQAANRTAWLRILRRYGISTARERFTWGELNWDVKGKFDHIRKEYATAGIKVLEVHHDSPKAFGGGSGGMMAIPADLGQVYPAWQRITGRFAPVWCAAESWNEENDEIFCGDTPPDRYAVYHKTLANAISRTAPAVLVMNGGFTEGVTADYLKAMGENDLLRYLDAAAFHIYCPPDRVADTLRRYRDWLTAYGRPGLPIWITEAGRGYPKTAGSGASRAEAIKAAADFTSQQSELRAAGADRVFPFVFAWYNLEATNFSLVDLYRSPTRSLAGYLNQIQLLAGSRYAGQLNLAVPNRVFRNGGRAVAVIRAGEVRLPAIAGAELLGLDGRSLPGGRDGAVAVPDGLLYLTAPWEALASLVVPAPEPPKPEPPRLGAFPGVILQYLPPVGVAASTRQGYKVAPEADGCVPLALRVWNFTGAECTVTLQVPGGNPAEQPVRVAAGVSTDVSVRLRLPELSPVLPTAFPLRLLDAKGVKIDQLSLDFTAKGDIGGLLKAFPNHVKVPLAAERCRAPAATGGKNVLTFPGDCVRAEIDLRACAGEWNNWAGIYLKLDGLELAGKSGVIFRVNCTGTGWSDITWELRGNDRFRTVGFPIDSATHDIYLPFENKRMTYFASADPARADSRFIPADITAIEFVIHSRNRLNVLNVGDIHLVGPAVK